MVSDTQVKEALMNVSHICLFTEMELTKQKTEEIQQTQFFFITKPKTLYIYVCDAWCVKWYNGI